MDCTKMIKDIATEVTKQMKQNNMKMKEVEWVLAQVKEEIYASTTVQIID